MALKKYFTAKYLLPCTSYCGRHWITNNRESEDSESQHYTCYDYTKLILCMLVDLILWILLLTCLLIIGFFGGIATIIAFIILIVVVVVFIILCIVILFCIGIVMIAGLWLLSVLLFITSPITLPIIVILMICFYCGIICVGCCKYCDD